MTDEMHLESTISVSLYAEIRENKNVFYREKQTDHTYYDIVINVDKRNQIFIFYNS